MRKIPFLFLTITLAIIMLASCGDDDCTSPETTPTMTSHSATGSWNSLDGVTTQDVYEYTFTAGSVLDVAVFAVSGSSVVRLALFAPGEGFDGINLLLGAAYDMQCQGQNQTVQTSVTIPTTGVYQLAVGRDWGSSAGATGEYTLAISSTLEFTGGSMTQDEMESEAIDGICPTESYSFSGSWSCGDGSSCQDVYDIELESGMVLSVDVTNVTGASVPRLALFAPGVELDGINLLTGTTEDRECVGQDMDDSFNYVASANGTYRLAVCRDWGSSAGGDGTYQVSITSSEPILPVVQSEDGVESQATGSVCP